MAKDLDIGIVRLEEVACEVSLRFSCCGEVTRLVQSETLPKVAPAVEIKMLNQICTMLTTSRDLLKLLWLLVLNVSQEHAYDRSSS